MKNCWQLLQGLNRDMRLYLLANGLSGFTVDGGICRFRVVTGP